MGLADLPAPALWHCYNYSYSWGCNSLWNHYSQEAEKSKNQRFIIWLLCIEHSGLPTGHVLGGKQKAQGQIYIPLSSSIRLDEMIPFSPRREGFWPLGWPSGLFPVSWPTEKDLLPGKERGVVAITPNAQRKDSYRLWSSRYVPALC